MAESDLKYDIFSVSEISCSCIVQFECSSSPLLCKNSLKEVSWLEMCVVSLTFHL